MSQLNQSEIQPETNNNRRQNPRVKSIARTGTAIIVLAGVLFLGIGIGNGTVTFGPDAPFRDSIQRTNGELSLDGVEELHNDLKDSFDGQLDTAKLEDGIKEGLVKAAGDPYTEYLTKEESKEFDEQLSGSFEGIGAELNKEDNIIVIIAPIAGFPAERAGLRAGDSISKIDGETAFDISVTDAVKKIRGPKGTSVKLEVIRDGKPVTLDITREQISIPSVKWEIADGNIGIMKISRFGEDTAALSQQAAQEFKDKNVTGVILDMRGNPGGLLDASVRVSSLWLPNGKTILQEKRNDKIIKTYTASGRALLVNIPTVVLVDGGSASASEITAGALKDNGAATIIGEKSYGKGSVQELRKLSSGGVLKVTIARWFTPNGRNIDKEGIEP
ncbi:MAG: S41 family peptidase, partial [Candidatus Saccharimonadales bacterium]